MEWNLDDFLELSTNCVLIYERVVVAILLQSLFRPIKPLSISRRWPTCGSSAYTSSRLVPPKPGWPCLDIDSTITIVSLPSELNFGHIVPIFLTFPLNEPLDFQSFFRFLHNQQSKESLLVHITKDLKAYANAWADKFADTNLRPHSTSWLL